ncbi:MAG: HAD family hydrolase, partial [Marivita sp.]|uniref:HAD family hydrolase n=1 Tax=Marivita sp. TaxID=2003365 RepID=UPI003EF13D0A
MKEKLQTIAFDADDTLWHNERAFRLTQERFVELLADHGDPVTLDAALQAAERRNLGHYGFGIKGFVLSMIETALEVTENEVPGAVVAELLAAGRDMLEHPIELLDGVADVVEELGRTHPLMLVTKGDLLDQERKLAQSGLGEAFSRVEIVSDKTPEIYGAVLARHGLDPRQVLMCGNSMKSDVLPVLD